MRASYATVGLRSSRDPNVANSSMNASGPHRGLDRVFIIEYDDCPPSLNHAHSRHWSYFHRHKRAWQDIFEALLLQVPRRLAYVHAEASLRFPVRRRRDEGNFRWLLEKALGDALVNGGWIADDTPDYFRTGLLTFEEDAGPKRTTVFLTTAGGK